MPKFYSVLHTTEHPVYNIVSNFHVNTFYIYKLSYFGTSCEILGSEEGHNMKICM